MSGKSSNIPVWLTLGFVAGLAFAWAYLREDKAAEPAPVPAASARPAPDRPEAMADAGTLAAVEQHFQRWGGYAVWTDDVTEFAVWNLRRHGYADYYEVRYVLGRYYFRTIPQLSRPIIDHGMRTRIPLQFTETQDMHDEFYRTHPGYDSSKEPIVDLTPKAPNPRSIGTAPGERNNTSADTPPAVKLTPDSP